VLTRSFEDRRRQGSQRVADGEQDGEETDTDPDVFSSGEEPPEGTTPPRYVAPAGGPPVDEFFRPLPVQ